LRRFSRYGPAATQQIRFCGTTKDYFSGGQPGITKCSADFTAGLIQGECDFGYDRMTKALTMAIRMATMPARLSALRRFED
jgi:hypothetical protein